MKIVWVHSHLEARGGHLIFAWGSCYPRLYTWPTKARDGSTICTMASPTLRVKSMLSSALDMSLPANDRLSVQPTNDLQVGPSSKKLGETSDMVQRIHCCSAARKYLGREEDLCSKEGGRGYAYVMFTAGDWSIKKLHESHCRSNLNH